MIENGILYLNRGQKCLIRLATSLHSLYKFYNGSTTIIQIGDLLPWFAEFVKTTFPKVTIKYVENDKQIKNTLQMKGSLWRHTPYKNTLYLDSDTIVMQPVDAMFDIIKTHKLVFTSFCGWKSSGRRIQGRIHEWKPYIGDEEYQKCLDYGLATNTGVYGFVVNNETKPHLELWEKMCEVGAKNNYTHRMLDEIALQVILHKIPHLMADSVWNASVKYGPNKNRIIVHFHGQKHCLSYEPCQYWKNNYWEMRNTSNYFKELEESYGDRRFKHYLKSVIKSDVTIVSAANAAYLPKLVANIDTWMKTEGLREQQFLIYTNGFRARARDTRPIRKYKNVTVLNWDYNTTNDRERMLAAFVLGVAKDVKTKYYMKLDGDCSVKKAFVWPDYQKYDVVASSWGFTKIKSATPKRHWLNTLDDFFGGKKLFKQEYDPVNQRKVRHKRFCSFCAIYKTDMTQKIADMCGGKIPVESEDTIMSLATQKWNKKFLHVNMREYFKP